MRQFIAFLFIIISLTSYGQGHFPIGGVNDTIDFPSQKTSGRAYYQNTPTVLQPNDFAPVGREPYINALDYGAVGDSFTINQDAITTAAFNAYSTGIRTVYIPKGWYLINNKIQLPSDVHLKLDANAVIELLPGSNSEIIMNADSASGNNNIEISGGRIIGNAAGQTFSVNHYCFGILLFGNNHYVHDIKIEKSKGWAISWWGDDHRYQNIQLLQEKRIAANGDGITGGGNNVFIDNIYGYTNDDMVAVATGGISIGGLSLAHFPRKSISSGIVSNIRSIPYDNSGDDSSYSHRLLALYTAGSYKIDGLTAYGLTGPTNSNAVILACFDTLGAVEDVNISLGAVDVKSNLGISLGMVGLLNLKLKNINISGIQGTNVISLYPLIKATNCVGIGTTVSDINFRSETQTYVFLDNESSMRDVKFNNITLADSAYSVAHFLYRKVNASVTPNLTVVEATNISIPPSSNIISRNSANAQIRYNGFGIRPSRTSLNPSEGDIIIDNTNVLSEYKSGSWVNVGNLATSTTGGQIISSVANSITLTSLALGLSTNAYSLSNSGLWPYIHTTGSTNFPTTIGSGLFISRGGASSSVGNFIIEKSNSNDSLITYATGTTGTSYTSFDTFASRRWVSTSLSNQSTNNLTSGTLGIARGGTGTTTTPSVGTVLIGNGSTYTNANPLPISTLTTTSTTVVPATAMQATYKLDCSGGNRIFTFTPAYTGQIIVVKRIDGTGNTCTVQATSGNIDGSPNRTLITQYESLQLQWDGTNLNALN